MKKYHLLIVSALNFLIINANAQTPGWQWAKGMGGTDDDKGNAVAVDALGNVYTAGVFSGTVDFDPGSGVFNITSIGPQDLFVSKLNASGDFIWARAFGGSTTYNPVCSSIGVTSSGNVYTTGDFSGTIDFDPGAGVFNLTATPFGGLNDIFISKLDSSGNFVWAKQLQGPAEKHCNAIEVDAAGNCYITGDYENGMDADPGAGQFYLSTSSGQNNHAFIVKLSASGGLVWAKQFGGTNFENTYGQDIALDALNNVYTTGNFAGTVDFDPGAGTYNLQSAAGFTVYISKLNSSGNFVWAKPIGGSSPNGCIGKAITVDADLNVITTGNFSGTADFDPSATQYDITAAGVPYSLFISKLNNAGDLVWAKAIGNSGYEQGLSVASDTARNIYTLGYFYGTIDVDPGAGIYILFDGGDFVSELDSAGNFVWARALEAGGEGNRSFFLDPSSNIYVAGSFYSDSLICGTDTLINANNSGSYGDIFTGKLADLSTGMESVESPDFISLHPNPSNGSFTVVLNDVLDDASFSLLDLFGKIIHTESINSSRVNIHLSNTPAGLYFMLITSGNKQYVRKVIINQN